MCIFGKGTGTYYYDVCVCLWEGEIKRLILHQTPAQIKTMCVNVREV